MTPRMGFPETLLLRCPDCGRKLKPAALMEEATLILKRSCRCKARWTLKISPARILGRQGIASTLTWVSR